MSKMSNFTVRYGYRINTADTDVFVVEFNHVNTSKNQLAGCKDGADVVNFACTTFPPVLHGLMGLNNPISESDVAALFGTPVEYDVKRYTRVVDPVNMYQLRDRKTGKLVAVEVLGSRGTYYRCDPHGHVLYRATFKKLFYTLSDREDGGFHSRARLQRAINKSNRLREKDGSAVTFDYYFRCDVAKGSTTVK